MRRQNDGIVLYFSTFPTEGEPSLQLILDCAGCDVQALKASANSGDFGVVAQVNSVVKAADTDESAPAYVLHGKLVDARFVSDYDLDKAMK